MGTWVAFEFLGVVRERGEGLPALLLQSTPLGGTPLPHPGFYFECRSENATGGFLFCNAIPRDPHGAEAMEATEAPEQRGVPGNQCTPGSAGTPPGVCLSLTCARSPEDCDKSC